MPVLIRIMLANLLVVVAVTGIVPSASAAGYATRAEAAPSAAADNFAESIPIKLSVGRTQAAGLTASLSTAVEELNEYRSTDLLLILTNNGPDPRTITRVVVTAPDFAQITYLGRELPRTDGRAVAAVKRTLAPGDQAVLVFGIRASGPLQPGEAFIVAEASSYSRTAASTIVASTKLKFAVMGESAFLDAVGLPSLLLVPGLVFAVVLWLLRRRVYPGGQATAAQAGRLSAVEEKVVFWVLAIPVGIALTFVYRPLTALIGEPRDILTAYGLDDILMVWLLAGIAGAVVWVLRWILPLMVRMVWRRLFIPEPGDDALRILGKLSRRTHLPLQSSSLCRPHGRWNAASENLPICVLREADGRSLVSSAILYSPTNRGIAAAVDGDDVRATVRAIRRAGDTVHIRYGSSVKMPVMVESSTVIVPPEEQPTSIVEQDEDVME